MHCSATARIFAFLCLLASVAAAQKPDNTTSALINEALDKIVDVKVDGVLPQALKSIEDKTGVRIVVTDTVYDLLPWGEQTRITARIENQTLRNALSAITRKLGLLWELEPFQVSLKPMPALARLGRRATIAELQSLELLRTTNFKGRRDRMTIQEVLDAMDRQLASIKSPSIALDIRSGDRADPDAGLIQLDKTVNVPRDANMSIVLEDLSRQSDATWYPWGTRIVVLPKEQQIRMQLDKPITAHFDGADVGRVIEDLASRCGTPIHVEPGAFQRIPAQYRSIKLDLENAPVRKALDDIRGVTGLDYVVKPDGVYLWNQNPASASVSAMNDPVLAIIQDGNLQILMRESETPLDVRAYLQHKKQEQFARMRQAMKDEGFSPTTQPAAQ